MVVYLSFIEFHAKHKIYKLLSRFFTTILILNMLYVILVSILLYVFVIAEHLAKL